MTTDLYTATDVKNAREQLLEEQQGKCAITGITIRPDRTAVLDHVHDDEQLVRAVIERETNALLGVTENAYKRHIKYWSDIPLSTLLRYIADYLDKYPKDKRYRHSSWVAKVKVFFNKLNSKQQDSVLESLGSTKGTNLKDRKAKFAKVVLDRSLGYAKIVTVINDVKEKENGKSN